MAWVFPSEPWKERSMPKLHLALVASLLMGMMVLASAEPARAAGCTDLAGTNLHMGQVLLNEPIYDCNSSPQMANVTFSMEGRSGSFFGNNSALGFLSGLHERSVMVKLKETRSDRCFKATVEYKVFWTPGASGSISCGASGFTGSDIRQWSIDTCAAGNAATLIGGRELKFVAMGASTFIDRVTLIDRNGNGCAGALIEGCSKVWGNGCVNCC
jgi:hypothetical protein